MEYEPQKERIYLSVFEDDDAPGRAKRQSGRAVKAVHACASDKAEYDWLNADVCVSRRGGRLKLDQLVAPAAAAQFIVSTYGREVMAAQEHVGVIAVDSQNRPVGAAIIHKGGEAASIVDPRSVLRVVLLLPATGFFIWHNHPSEDPTPSRDDMDFTTRLSEASQLLGLRFVDSLVITPNPAVYTSLVESGHVRRR